MAQRLSGCNTRERDVFSGAPLGMANVLVAAATSNVDGACRYSPTRTPKLQRVCAVETDSRSTRCGDCTTLKCELTCMFNEGSQWCAQRMNEQQADARCEGEKVNEVQCAQSGMGLERKDGFIQKSEDVYVTTLPPLCLTWSSK